MATGLLFILVGYFSGSIMFARIAGKLFRKPQIIQNSSDKNPGTANAFKHGGFWCGVVTLLGDLAKGAIPLWLYQFFGGDFTTYPILSALVFFAPVLGHAFPVYFRFIGGKGIAVTFGCLIGLFPDYVPLAVLALLFILFSTILRVTPHFQRTIVTYLATLLGIFLLGCATGIWLGFIAVTLVVLIRMHLSTEERTKMKIKLLWMR